MGKTGYTAKAKKAYKRTGAYKKENHLLGQAKHSQPDGVLLKKVQGVCTSTDKSWGSSDVYR